MRLIDAEALKKRIMLAPNKNEETWDELYDSIIFEIDNAPTVETKFELKTENGITYPNALDNMTFSHSLSVEERQNIIQAYMLGANANARPHGKWIGVVYSNTKMGVGMCNQCGVNRIVDNFCSNCGADMRDTK